jgi:hypothetical protein
MLAARCIVRVRTPVTHDPTEIEPIAHLSAQRDSLWSTTGR